MGALLDELLVSNTLTDHGRFQHGGGKGLLGNRNGRARDSGHEALRRGPQDVVVGNVTEVQESKINI